MIKKLTLTLIILSALSHLLTSKVTFNKKYLSKVAVPQLNEA